MKKIYSKKGQSKSNTTGDNRVQNNITKLNTSKKDGKLVRFNYINQSGITVKNVLAQVLGQRGSGTNTIFNFGIRNTSNSSAHPGFRPMRVDKIRSVRVLKQNVG